MVFRGTVVETLVGECVRVWVVARARAGWFCDEVRTGKEAVVVGGFRSEFVEFGGAVCGVGCEGRRNPR